MKTPGAGKRCLRDKYQTIPRFESVSFRPEGEILKCYNIQKKYTIFRFVQNNSQYSHQVGDCQLNAAAENLLIPLMAEETAILGRVVFRKRGHPVR